jgi:hypothetical protein
LAETASLGVEVVLNTKLIIALGAAVLATGCKEVTPETPYFVINNPVRPAATNVLSAPASPSATLTNSLSATNPDQNLLLPPARNPAGSSSIQPPPRAPSDIELTQRVRQALVRERGSFSLAPGSIDVFAHNGQVTLRGPITSDTDRRQIESIAGRVSGVGQVNSQLQLQPR